MSARQETAQQIRGIPKTREHYLNFNGMVRKKRLRDPYQRRGRGKKPQAVPFGQVVHGRHPRLFQVVKRCAEKQFEVVDQSVFVDSGYEQTKVAAECVKHGHWVSLTPVMRRWACWVALKGSNTETWAHADKAGNKTYKIFSPGGYLDPNIGKKAGGMKGGKIKSSFIEKETHSKNPRTRHG